MIGRLTGCLALVLMLAVFALAGCGGGDKPDLTVSAAASLKRAFTSYGDQIDYADPRFSFAGSDALAAQIRAGARPDVFAAANTKLPAQLYAAGLVEKPRQFASNRLVVAVPRGATKVRAVADLTRRGVTVAMGSATVPVGAYTRQVLGRLPATQARAVLANVRSNEPDVSGVVGKVAEGAVDAGFVYVTDVGAAGGKLRAVELPPSLRPRVAYAAAVVKGAKHSQQARRFVAGLLTGSGQAALRAAGFDPPPAR